MTDLTYLQNRTRARQPQMAANKAGAQARKEIQRRKAIGFFDGTMAPVIDESA